MTKQTLSKQQLDEIAARIAAARHCPNAEANGRLDGQHTLSGSFSHIRCELCSYTRPRGERVEESAALLAEVRRLRTERTRYRTAWRLARTRALSTGGAADRYAKRARDGQTALQNMLAALLGSQMELDATQARVTALEAVLAKTPAPAAPRTLTESEHNAAWHAIEGAAGEDMADPGTVLNAVLHALGITPPGAEETHVVADDSDYVKPADRPTEWAKQAADLDHEGFGHDEIAARLCIDETTVARLLASGAQ